MMLEQILLKKNLNEIQISVRRQKNGKYLINNFNHASFVFSNRKNIKGRFSDLFCL